MANWSNSKSPTSREQYSDPFLEGPSHLLLFWLVALNNSQNMCFGVGVGSGMHNNTDYYHQYVGSDRMTNSRSPLLMMPMERYPVLTVIPCSLLLVSV